LDRIRSASILKKAMLIGLASTGIHSNGLTLARRVLLDQEGYESTSMSQSLVGSWGRIISPNTDLCARGLRHARRSTSHQGLLHITGDGLLNLRRIQAPMGFVIEQLPEPQPIFRLIQARGR
jgi:phosphoribosylformylglycinamidine cyclo-ligase